MYARGKADSAELRQAQGEASRAHKAACRALSAHRYAHKRAEHVAARLKEVRREADDMHWEAMKAAEERDRAEAVLPLTKPALIVNGHMHGDVGNVQLNFSK